MPEDQGLPIAHAGSIALTEAPPLLVHEAKTGYMRRLGAARFEHAVRREIARRGGQRPCLRIVRGLFTALADPAGVIAHRSGGLILGAGGLFRRCQ